MLRFHFSFHIIVLTHEHLDGSLGRRDSGLLPSQYRLATWIIVDLSTKPARHHLSSNFSTQLDLVRLE